MSKITITETLDKYTSDDIFSYWLHEAKDEDVTHKDIITAVMGFKKYKTILEALPDKFETLINDIGKTKTYKLRHEGIKIKSYGSTDPE